MNVVTLKYPNQEEAKGNKLAEGKDSRAATGVALALWHSGAETQSAVEDARKAITSPSQKYDLSRVELLCGKLDEAAEAVELAIKFGAKRLKPGDTQLTNLYLLQAGVELACYVEAAWPSIRRGGAPMAYTPRSAPE